MNMRSYPILALSPVYTIQVLHPSLHSSFLNSSFLIVYTIQETWIKKLERTWMEKKCILFFFQLGWNLDGDWPIRRQNPYQHQFVNVNNNNYTCCAKMVGKEVTPKCRKKTVTWINEMIEDLIDFRWKYIPPSHSKPFTSPYWPLFGA